MFKRIKQAIINHKEKEKEIFRIKDEKHPTIKNDQNQHIREFIQYYLCLEHSPNFAVLINGAWGIGKTHLVKSILSEAIQKQPYSYVSLYGIDNIDAIDTALYQSLHPALASKSVKIVGRAGKAALKFARIDGVLSISDFLNFGRDRLYVFDDLERAILKPELILGYINELVEHDGCKVIIIGNEQKLLDIPDYLETREKLIGRSLEVQPEIGSAFSHFLTKISSTKASDALKTHSQTVLQVFTEASSRNFRILQQTMWDFERVANCLNDSHFENFEGIKSLIETFFAVSIEYKAGKLTQKDITERPNGLLRAMMQNREKDKTQNLEIADKRFSEADLYNSILSNDVLENLLSKGLVNQEMVRESLDLSSFYVNLSNEPAWRAVWYGYEREEAAFQAALNKMEMQFKERAITEIGVILHIVGIRLWLSKIGVLDISRKDGLEQGMDYIRDLYDRKTLPASSGRSFGPDSYQGFAGLGIHEIETEDFLEFIKFVETMQEKIAKDMYPEQAKSLLDEMELDAEIFLRKTCLTNSNDNIFARTPLLAAISPKEFVTRVIGLQAASRRKVILALNIRYSQGNLEHYLSDEKNWLEKVIEEFYIAIESLTPMGHWSVKNSLKHYLDEFIPKTEQPSSN
ncbi:P-loop NTPase fold protein [Pseudomonas fluorescens]|uniref:P-loop NTPase fold protein n=1 Tax=Pseudomonas fluorescens TaxID=294 RepID=UPI001A9F9777|nr:P-loop NTPase fold protein [Pseudomonas fluorescens]QTD35899.1 hypothetical protein JZM58_13885 [Pseudomonas fluorescens]